MIGNLSCVMLLKQFTMLMQMKNTVIDNFPFLGIFTL